MKQNRFWLVGFGAALHPELGVHEGGVHEGVASCLPIEKPWLYRAVIVRYEMVVLWSSPTLSVRERTMACLQI